MKSTSLKTSTVMALAYALALAGLAPDALALTHRETTTETFELAPVDGKRTLIVDTVWGAIRVVGRQGAGDRIEMKLTKKLEAPTERWLERARNEVKLEQFRQPGELELFVDGPWRDRDDRYEWADNSSDVEYEAIYDFELTVPTDTDVRVRTVLDGNVEVIGVDGEHSLSNVTGDVRFRDVRGSGRFKTVSGSVEGNLIGRPTGPSRWKTVSGDLDVRLTPDLDADLVLTTKWGEIWSEYNVEPLPTLPARSERKKGKFVIKSDTGARFRVGAGGPELQFETLSGDIRVRKEKGD